MVHQTTLYPFFLSTVYVFSPFSPAFRTKEHFFYSQYEAKMKTLETNMKEMESKKRILEEAVDSLNEEIAKLKAKGNGSYLLVSCMTSCRFFCRAQFLPRSRDVLNSARYRSSKEITVVFMIDCEFSRKNSNPKRSQGTLCMNRSRGTKSVLLDGKLRQSKEKQRKVQLDWLKPLCFRGCGILLPSRMTDFVS